LPYVFDRFYRGEKSRSRATGGSGLGLAIARGIVEAHRGQIRVESEVGHGAKFVLTLPQ
jgi:signal transduction histidine kinase